MEVAHRERQIRLDIFKAIAIIAVVFYHLGGGILPFGYLGVDIFLVISGYLLMRNILSSIDKGDYCYFKFLIHKLVRLWPLLIIISFISLLLGYFLMLPDDLENLSESVAASLIYGNNILAAITTGNYWNAVNIYKPLMHTWYLGVLMQSYVFIGLIVAIVKRIAKDKEKCKKIIKNIIVILTLISFILYILPYFNGSDKFYYLSFRLFEITCGSIIAFIPKIDLTEHKSLTNFLEALIIIFILLILVINNSLLSVSVKLLLIVFLTASYIFITNNTLEEVNRFGKLLGLIGKSSLSIYLVHQVIVAFMYYSVTDNINILTVILFLLVVTFFSVISYLFIEKPINNIAKNGKKEKWIFILLTISSALIGSIALVIYFKAGVVRDIPELDIYTNDVHRGMHAEYCDRVYDYDHDFVDDGKIKVLIFGNSFARDWANILLESEIVEYLQISYIYPYTYEYIMERQERFDEADYIFYALGPGISLIPNYVTKLDKNKLYLVGDKYFGTSNGLIYSNRNKGNYFSQTIKISDEYLNYNKSMADKYGDHYIDLISVVLINTNEIKVFTPEQKYISQDGLHLTNSGAKYFANNLDFSRIFDLDYNN